MAYVDENQISKFLNLSRMFLSIEKHLQSLLNDSHIAVAYYNICLHSLTSI